ncbi:MAG: EAL domain-containing protein [Oleiphilaceae bacterium]|nr:EAL domain-containing protein [Oleiphilaceae bacterium]
MRAEQLEQLLQHQTELIGRIALEPDLNVCLLAIAERLEAILGVTSARCCILRHDADHVRMAVAPQLTTDYPEHFDALNLTLNELAPSDAHEPNKLRVITLELDANGCRHAHLARQMQFHHAWLCPVFSSSNQRIGSVLIYLQQREHLSRLQRETIIHFGHLASLAIEKHLAVQREQVLTRCLRQAHEKVSSLLTLLPELLLVLDDQGQLVDVYGGDYSLLDDNSSQTKGQPLESFWPHGETNQILAHLEQALASSDTQNFETEITSDALTRSIEHRMVSIRHYKADQPEVSHVLWMLRDVTPQKQAQQRIEQLAYFDPLTQLPNRRLLMNRTQKLIERVARDEAYGALIYIDLNEFKRINDSLGHYIGDELLVSVAQRLQDCVRESDTFARIGGDEFVVLLERLRENDVEIASEARRIAERMLASLKLHFELSGGQFYIGASIGIALIDACDSDPLEVLKHADAAMYEAKHRSQGQICFHNAHLQQRIDERLQLESEINQSLARHDFIAYFQPQVDQHGELIAAEALIRWQHPNRGMIQPCDFLNVADGMGVMPRMQELMVEHACSLIAAMKRENMLADNFRVALNICPSQLKLDGFAEKMASMLDSYKVSPDRFVLELTEGMLIDDLPRTIKILETLRDMGFRLSIDDFGTGYSSLAYLNRLPMNEIKIDKSFIADIKHCDDPTGIVDSVLSLSQHFQFDVIAEGIEDAQQFEAISRKSIRGLQGYFLARPMPQQEFVDWMRAA